MQSMIQTEKIKAFCNKYVEKIGTTVCDDIFDAVASSKKGENGLTRVRLATEVIRRFFYVPVTKAIRTNNQRILLKLLEYLYTVLNEVIGITVGKEWLNNAVLPYSYGNNKLGKGIITFNLSPAFLCPSMCLGLCKHCSDCYAMKSEIRHEKELLRNILSIIKILKYDIETIIKDTLKALGNKKDTLTSEFVRFSANGDILNDFVLSKANQLAIALLDKYPNLLSIYTYTHNTRLNLDLATHIVVNQSDNDREAVKATIVLFEWDNSYFDPSKYILCLGNCSECPYCKNKDDKRTVIFMAHGGGLKAIETVPEDVIQFYSLLLAYDNDVFLNQARLERFASLSC